MSRLRRRFRRIVQPFLARLYRWYLSKPRWYRYEGLSVRVLPTVFHPGFLISTKVFLKFALQQNLQNKKVLELGAGSGLIALSAVRAGAIVTATDINPNAIASIKESAKKNQLSLTLIESDLFQKIPSQHFDFIFINPPYYPRQVTNLEEVAFFCGVDFDYFRQLFPQLFPFLKSTTRAFMILSEDCEIETIREIARENKIEMQLILETKKVGELQYIFELKMI